MELKKVWMLPETEKKSHYGYRTVGGILGIVFLMTALLFAGNFLSLSLGLPQQSFSMILVLLATALGIILAVKLGWRGMQDAMIFFLYKNDRLWVMDTRGLSYHGRGFWGFPWSNGDSAGSAGCGSAALSSKWRRGNPESIEHQRKQQPLRCSMPVTPSR